MFSLALTGVQTIALGIAMASAFPSCTKRSSEPTNLDHREDLLDLSLLVHNRCRGGKLLLSCASDIGLWQPRYIASMYDISTSKSRLIGAVELAAANTYSKTGSAACLLFLVR
jgi:hypothetical protein